DAFGDSRGHLLGLAVPHADGSIAVAHHDEGGEAEPPPTLDDLGDAVDGDDALDIRGLLGPAVATAVPAVAALASGTAAAALWSSHSYSSLLRLALQRQSTGPGTVGYRGHAAVIAVAGAVEDHTTDAGGLRPLGDQLTDAARLRCLVAFLVP